MNSVVVNILVCAFWSMCVPRPFSYTTRRESNRWVEWLMHVYFAKGDALPAVVYKGSWC